MGKQKKPFVTSAYMHTYDGFTLMELLVVIVILGVLAGLVVPRIMDEPHKARVVKARMHMEQLSMALESFRMDNGFYPDSAQGLAALVTKPESGHVPENYRSGGYVEKLSKDPWGAPYVYIFPGNHGAYDLLSYGADSSVGGEGNNADISGWETE